MAASQHHNAELQTGSSKLLMAIMENDSQAAEDFGQPKLTNTAAAREATPVDPAPVATKHKNLSHPEPPSQTSKGSNDAPKDYFAGSDHFTSTPPRLHSRSDPDLHSGRPSPNLPEGPTTLTSAHTTEIRAGLVQKTFHVPTELLVETSPFFAEMKNSLRHPNPPHRLDGPLFFPDLDEFAVALFIRWLHGGKLHGPHDFHSLNHYLGLYVLATKFGIEPLKNLVMDEVRSYYHRESMTAPAFRLDYIYANTRFPNPMREFLITTAAYRALHEHDYVVSESVRGVLRRGGDVAADFAIALIQVVHSGYQDVRKGDRCRWHEHDHSKKCAPAPPPEPFEGV